MKNPDIKNILTLLNDENEGVSNLFEIYHAIIEYIKSGKAINDMGHPDFYMGAIGYPDYNYTTYPPDIPIFKLAKAFSTYLNHFNTNYIWYRDLSSWKKFCKFIMEIHQVHFFERNRRLIISYKHYLKKEECPACGLKRLDFFASKEDEIYLSKKGNLIYVNCRRCGNYILTTGSFKYLDDFEKKSKLHVFLATRPEKDRNTDIKITPKILKEIIT